MHKSEVGEIAERHWKEIPDRFSYVVLGSFVVMPNHFHGIINIQKDEIDFVDNVETRLIASLHYQQNLSQKSQHGGVTGNHNPMLHQNLSRVIRWFTGRVTYEAHKLNTDFNWQRRFYDRIIRDSIEYRRISSYILLNPSTWEDDIFY
jgi:hypothetical protein